ncbi:MAG: hypothetical protein QG567_240 [Campylobacterota bacterium]|nr:hypothetical protein [Campylobacterota bacterium]
MLTRKGRPAPTSSSDTEEDLQETGSTNSLSSSSGGRDSQSQLDQFAKKILVGLSNDSMPPFPSYYQLYFEKMLDEMPFEFKKQISELIETESDTENEKRMRIEQQLQQGFSFSKEILQEVSILYKNVNAMVQVAQRRIADAKAINNPSAVKNLTLAVGKDLEKLLLILNRQSVNIKTLYAKSAQIIKEVQGETVYDAQYGIFNKRYLVEQVRNEVVQMKKFNHVSTLIVAKLGSSVAIEVNEKQLAMINRTISKLFLKTSRRSDVVAHLGDGMFAMLLKHTDIENASRACGRLGDMTGQTHFFIGENEIKLEIKIGIAPLAMDKEVENIVAEAMDAQLQADRSSEVFKVFSENN